MKRHSLFTLKYQPINQIAPKLFFEKCIKNQSQFSVEYPIFNANIFCNNSIYNGYYYMLKNITLSADEALIRKAREKAHRENTTLNALFRKWLRQYVRKNIKTVDYQAFMDRLSYIKVGRTVSRDDMNER